MKPRVVVLTGLEALAMALVTLWLANQPGAISRRTYDRIRLGMSEKVVDAIIGIPPGRYIDRKGLGRGVAISEGFMPSWFADISLPFLMTGISGGST